MIESAPDTVIRSLVVDDDRDFRMLVRIWMERVEPYRYQVVGEASSGEECLDRIKDLNPGLVLLDLSMPNTDPFRLISEILERRPSTRIVVLSGFDSDQVESKVVALGAVGYLEKCADISLLRERLDRMVDSVDTQTRIEVDLTALVEEPLDSVVRIR